MYVFNYYLHAYTRVHLLYGLSYNIIPQITLFYYLLLLIYLFLQITLFQNPVTRVIMYTRGGHTGYP